jgi:hypothetical protein
MADMNREQANFLLTVAIGPFAPWIKAHMNEVTTAITVSTEWDAWCGLTSEEPLAVNVVRAIEFIGSIKPVCELIGDGDTNETVEEAVARVQREAGERFLARREEWRRECEREGWEFRECDCH